jgi:NADPH:quinone reductase-like Zn-dependent oxidoreductase
MRAYHIKKTVSGTELLQVELKQPEPGPGQVRIRIEAVSLNYRDLIILNAAAQGPLDGRIPISDGAGTVDAIGAGVSRLQRGDRVAAQFFRDWVSGPFHSRYMTSALGGDDTDGMLVEFVVLPETALVTIPDHLSVTEAATLPCAAVTAWQALAVRGGLVTGDTLLVQGTGGVALFGLQFAKAMGARIIIISSSDAKLAKARLLGADVLINYLTTPDWDVEVNRATRDEGVTHVLELGGPETYERSLNAVAAGGKIAQIGVLTGFGPKPNLRPLQFKNADILGITVGSGAHFTDMNDFIARHRIAPVINRVFAFEEAAAAYEYLRSGQHFGKVVIRMT